jgi:hypothetical protein
VIVLESCSASRCTRVCAYPDTRTQFTACATVQYPVTAAATGAVYLLGAVGYFVGYSTGTPGNRVTYGGQVRFAAQGVLMGACLRMGAAALLGARR